MTAPRYVGACVACGEVLFVSYDRPARGDVEDFERHARGHAESALPLSQPWDDPVSEILAQLADEWGCGGQP